MKWRGLLSPTRKNETNLMTIRPSTGKCLICKRNVKKKEIRKFILFNRRLDSLTKLIDCIRVRYENAEIEFVDLFNEVKDSSAQDLFNQGISYPRQ